jgi:Mg/Co/Ni transporter MgtE
MKCKVIICVFLIVAVLTTGAVLASEPFSRYESIVFLVGWLDKQLSLITFSHFNKDLAFKLISSMDDFTLKRFMLKLDFNVVMNTLYNLTEYDGSPVQLLFSLIGWR